MTNILTLKGNYINSIESVSHIFKGNFTIKPKYLKFKHNERWIDINNIQNVYPTATFTGTTTSSTQETIDIAIKYTPTSSTSFYTIFFNTTIQPRNSIFVKNLPDTTTLEICLFDKYDIPIIQTTYTKIKNNSNIYIYWWRTLPETIDMTELLSNYTINS